MLLDGGTMQGEIDKSKLTIQVLIITIPCPYLSRVYLFPVEI